MLTEHDILYITETIDKAEIAFSHLRDELIDHVCCEIESLMEKGLSFQEAFNNIKSKVGIRELEKVQENTLLLIDKKYRFMKTVMKISGVLSLVLLIAGTLGRMLHVQAANFVMLFGFLFLCFVFLPSAINIMRKENKSESRIILYLAAYIGSIGLSIGICFKVMHWPGTNLILIFGLTFLSFVFLPMLWFNLKKNIVSSGERRVVLAGIIAGSIFLLGILFKMQRWPGASMLFWISVIALIFIFLPIYTIIKYKTEESVRGNYIYLVFSLFWFVLLTMLLQMNIDFMVIKVFDNNASTRLRTINYFREQANASTAITSDSITNRKISFVKLKIEEINLKIENVKKEMLFSRDPETAYEKDNALLADKMLIDYHDLARCSAILFGNNDSGPVHHVFSEITEVREFFLHNSKSNDQSALVAELLNTDIPSDLKKKCISWEKYMFGEKSPLSQYQILLLLQQKLRIAETEMIEGLK